jgi:hypothetical protein
MSGLREESPNLREDLPAGAPTARLTDRDDPGVLAETEDPGIESFATSRVIFAVVGNHFTVIAMLISRKTAIREELVSMVD